MPKAMRLPGWEARLSAVIAAEQRRADYRGRCVDFMCASVRALYGVDPMPQWRARFEPAMIHETHASADMTRRAMEECADRFGWSVCGWEEVRDGCIALVHPPRALSTGFLLVSGTKLLRTVPLGLHATGLRFADEYWVT